MMVSGWVQRIGARPVGGLLAASIALVWSPAGSDAFWSFPLLHVAFATAVPVAAMLACGLSHRIREGRSFAGTTARLAIGVLVANSFLVGLIFAISDRLPTPGLPEPWAILLIASGYGALGLVYIGWIAIVPALIAAAVWTYAMHSLFRQHADATAPGTSNVVPAVEDLAR